MILKSTTEPPRRGCVPLDSETVGQRSRRKARNKGEKDGIWPVCHKRGIRDVNNGKVHGRVHTLHLTHTEAKSILDQLRTWKEITPQKDDVEVG